MKHNKCGNNAIYKKSDYESLTDFYFCESCSSNFKVIYSKEKDSERISPYVYKELFQEDYAA